MRGNETVGWPPSDWAHRRAQRTQVKIWGAPIWRSWVWGAWKSGHPAYISEDNQDWARTLELSVQWWWLEAERGCNRQGKNGQMRREGLGRNSRKPLWWAANFIPQVQGRVDFLAPQSSWTQTCSLGPILPAASGANPRAKPSLMYHLDHDFNFSHSSRLLTHTWWVNECTQTSPKSLQHRSAFAMPNKNETETTGKCE